MASHHLLGCLFDPTDIGTSPAIIQLNILAVDPSGCTKPIVECVGITLPEGIVFADCHQHTDAPDPRRLLSARDDRPCSRRTTKKRDELAPMHVPVAPAMQKA